MSDIGAGYLRYTQFNPHLNLTCLAFSVMGIVRRQQRTDFLTVGPRPRVVLFHDQIAFDEENTFVKAVPPHFT